MKLTKLFLSIASVCFSIAIMIFGVMAATQVTYTVTGRVSYDVSDTYVLITTKVYKFGGEEALAPANPSALATMLNTDLNGKTLAQIDTFVAASTNNYSVLYDDEEHSTSITRQYNTYDDQGDSDGGITKDSETGYLQSDIALRLNTQDKKVVIVVVSLKNLSDAALDFSVANNQIKYANGTKTSADATVNVIDYLNITGIQSLNPVNTTGDEKCIIVGFAIKDARNRIETLDFSFLINVENP